MSRQSKNVRNREIAKGVTKMHLAGHRAGRDTMNGLKVNKGKSQARRAAFANK